MAKKATGKPAAKPTGKARILSVDFTGVESGGAQFVRVPEGDYGLKIKKVEGKKGEDSGKPYLLFTFEITQGNKKGTGKKITHTCSMQPKALWNLKNLLEACGMKVPSSAVKIDLDKLVGKECGCTITDDEYEGRKKSVISVIFPISDLGSTSDDGEELEEGAEEAGELEEEEGGEESTEEESESTEEEESDLFS